MSAQPLVSVVIPFHNSARHLRECIASVLAQSYAHFELILQDNASSDESTAIALEYVPQDERIRYIRLDQLLPQVANYNLALTRLDATSEYCKVVQADDWIAADCLRLMIELAERSPRVGLVSAYRLKGGSVEGDGLPYTQSVLNGREAARLHLLTPAFLFGSPTTVMYRSNIVRDRRPFFMEGRLNEDTETCYEILRDWDFGFVHQILSLSRVEDESITGRLRDMDPGILDRLINVRRYGREYLSATEYEARLKEIERRYYRRLGHAVLAARGSAYWRFHTQGLRTQGPGLEPLKLLRGVGRELIGLVTCPRRAVEVMKSWKRTIGQ